MLLSNRLTRWAYAGHEGQVGEHEVSRLRLAEARMADVVFAASGIETSYLRVRRVTAALAVTPYLTPVDGRGSLPASLVRHGSGFRLELPGAGALARQ